MHNASKSLFDGIQPFSISRRAQAMARAFGGPGEDEDNEPPEPICR